MQNRPVCFRCTEAIDQDPVFEALCGHDTCPSACWHPLCLMEFRDMRAESGRFEVVGVLVRPWLQEHTENG